MRKWLLALSLVLIVFGLSACTIESVEEYEKSKDERTEEVAETNEEVREIEKTSTTENKKEGNSTDKPSVTKEQTSSTSLNNSNENSASSGKEVPNTATPTTPTPIPTKPATEKMMVTIGIDAKTLLIDKHWAMLKPELQSDKYVPKDGVILAPAKYEITENETVWELLKRVTKEHKIPMEHMGASSNIYGSIYVEGINHLYEFSAGELSGWNYIVNGEFPGYGVSEYTLKDGDVVEVRYTVDLGKDIGATGFK